MLIAVDPVAETVAEALEHDAQLLVTHHPLLLRGVHAVPADDPKGGLVHRLVRAGVGLFCAHTNADAAEPGVSDALAHVLGLRVTGVLDPRDETSRTGLGGSASPPNPSPCGHSPTGCVPRCPTPRGGYGPVAIHGGW